MDELLKQAAAALGYPETMVERSALARAKADGVSVEEVLAAWAGGGEIVAGAGGDTAEPAAAASDAPEAAPAPPEPASGPVVEVLEGEAPPDAAVEAEEDEAPDEEEVEEERPRASSGIPRWLAATFVVIPTVAFLYAVFLPNGPGCGDGAQLAVDPVTGLAVGCDGAPYGVDEVDLFAIGEVVYSRCAACHGADGQGGGNFPVLAGGAVLATFPQDSCGDHVEWVRLGTAGWPEATYGANATSVGSSGAQMPGFGNALTEEELRSVVLYERVAFGGQAVEAAIADCAPDGPPGEPPVEAAGE